MKTSEVIEALERNPNKRFECNLFSGFKALMSTRDGYFDLKIFNCYGELISQEKKGGAFNENIRVNKDWQEVKQPVTWQEAIEAWVNGNTISCEFNGHKSIYSQGYLGDQNTLAPIKSEFKEGTWYIED